MSTRNPFPFPRHQNDEDFTGRKIQNDPYSVPNNFTRTQGDEPWLRLNRSATLTSMRRTIDHYDPKAPRDSLDFVLKSHYNHHKEFLKPKNETLVQLETLGAEHGRQLKNRIIKVSAGQTGPDGVRMSGSAKKESVHSIKNAIEGHHTQTTNAGYSRKPDGGFFTS